MATGHGGNLRELAARAGLDRDAILDFSASVNPLGPPESLRMTLSRTIDQLVNYPDPECAELVAAIAERLQVDDRQVVVGNGSTEVLFALARACDFDRAVIPVPSYIDYGAAVRRTGRAVQHVALAESNGFALDWELLEAEVRPRDLVMLGQPNNPTGLMLDSNCVRAFAVRHPAATLVVDEAFADFVDGYGSLARELPANLIVVRSLTKFYAIPGLRLGFAVSRPDVAAAMRGEILPWSVNSLAQAAGVAVLADQDYARQTLTLLASARRQLADDLTRLPGLHVYDGAANYLLVRVDRADINAVQLARRLLCQGIAIRTFDASQHLDERFFRVAVRRSQENERLIEALADAVNGGRWTVDGAERGKREAGKRSAELAPRHSPLATRRNKTPALMIQGTSSNAGKTVLVAALGRILLQDGVRVAPFKSQNMSLNSFVTCDGGEMGRAQVVQAQACRLEPDVRMNPILLKPNSETGSQVIVRGRPVGNMNVAEYIRFKGQAAAAAQECYDALAAEFDVMLLEGAGSPGEVNLKSHDIVNMRMAEHAAAPVLIVGDIDRGGVFAAFVGTMEVLAPWERQLVAGWIVNRFRGDATLLQPALDYTRLYTGRPVLGVVPYLAAIDLPQEDSVEFKSGALDTAPSNGAAVEIAVIDLPHISNFTDFDAFRSESDVRLRIIRTVDQLQTPDAVIIPGSKNTLDDLAYLRRTGLARRIAALAGEGATEIVGICGGFQMLGGEVRDPLGIESSNGDSPALGLIDAHTVLAAEKTLVRTSARHQPSGLEVTGYEIHHGQTTLGSAVAWFTRSDGQVVGAARADQRVWGTYLHGVFDADGFRRWFIDRFRVRRGMTPLGHTAGHYDIEPALDRLADAVRQSIRMDEIYRLLKI